MQISIPKKSWWETSSYPEDSLLSAALEDPQWWGPNGPAFVKVNENGSTQRGWSEEAFAANYARNAFSQRRAEFGYNQGKHAAALVMRSGRLVGIDIDGKNGGLEGIGQLGALPITGAETSKSGNGYHLIYSTTELWTEARGFDLVPDQIGIVPGVDIRGVGCLYHHSTQRWNSEPIAPAPDWLIERLLHKKQQREQSNNTITKVLETEDPTEILMLQNNLMDELKKPMPPGRRNNTLFAVGSQLARARAQGWETAVRSRAAKVGLDDREIDKLIANIKRSA